MSVKNIITDYKNIYDNYTKCCTQYKMFFYVKTRFKYNFKYFMNLILNKYSILFFNYRSMLSFKLKKFNKQDRYATQNFVMMLLVSKLVEVFNYNFFYYYKNLTIFHILFLRDFFKLVDLFQLKDFRVFFGMGLSCNLNRYFKKVKTRKKFKKKMFYKEFVYSYGTAYLLL